jgi:hypothetical protein
MASLALTSAIMRLVPALAAAVLLAAPALGQAYSVRGIEIDATADTAFEAQRRAMTEGQVRAAESLIRRLTLPEDRMEAGPPPMTAETAAGLIAGLQISDEQRSATRYRGVLTVDFDRRAVSDYLSGLSLPYVESQAAPILVVPVLEGEEGRTLWSGPWYRAWLDGGFETALTPFLALGSRTDEDGAPVGRGLITASEAMNLDTDALGALARAYDVDAVAVIAARRGGEAVRASGVVLTFGEGLPARETLDAVASRGGFAAAAQRLVDRREETWKRASVVRGGEEAELKLTLLFESFPQWRALQRAVAGASLVSNARLDALSRSGAAMTISHRGTREQIRSELAARGARLEEDEAMGWIVRPR